MKKKSVSPVIATVLLIAIVIVIALILLMWALSLIKEIPQKQGKSAEQACQEISLQTNLYNKDGKIILQTGNIGNIPVNNFDIRKIGNGKVDVQKVNEELGIGVYKEVVLDKDYEGVEIIPVILTKLKSGEEQNYTCDKYAIVVK